jgi:hypothetical protein
VKSAGTEIACRLKSGWVRIPGINDDRNAAEFRRVAHELQNCEAGIVGMYEVEQDEIDPPNSVFCAGRDEAFQIGDGPLNGIGNMPFDGNASLFCGGLKENLIVRAVVDVKDVSKGSGHGCLCVPVAPCSFCTA